MNFGRSFKRVQVHSALLCEKWLEVDFAVPGASLTALEPWAKK